MDPADQPNQPDPRTDRPDRAEQVRDQAGGRQLAARLFRFSQLEFPWALGPPDGRYLLREDDVPSHVLILATLGAPERRSLLSRRRRDAPPQPEPTPVTTGRATIVDVGTPLAGDRDAAA